MDLKLKLVVLRRIEASGLVAHLSVEAEDRLEEEPSCQKLEELAEQILPEEGDRMLQESEAVEVVQTMVVVVVLCTKLRR